MERIQFRAGRKIETKKDVGVRVFTLKIASDRKSLVLIHSLWFGESNAVATVVAKWTWRKTPSVPTHSIWELFLGLLVGWLALRTRLLSQGYPSDTAQVILPPIQSCGVLCAFREDNSLFLIQTWDSKLVLSDNVNDEREGDGDDGLRDEIVVTRTHARCSENTRGKANKGTQ